MSTPIERDKCVHCYYFAVLNTVTSFSHNIFFSSFIKFSYKHFQIRLTCRPKLGIGKASSRSMSVFDNRAKRPKSAIPAFGHQVMCQAVAVVVIILLPVPVSNVTYFNV